MTIKQQGGIFGRNPTFNDVEVEGTLTLGSSISLPADSISGDAIDGGTPTPDGLAVDGNVLYVDSVNNRVGINTSSVDEALHIEGSLSGAIMGLKIQNNNLDANSRAGIKMDTANGTWTFAASRSGGCALIGPLGEAWTTNNTGNLAFPNGQGIDFSATSGTGTSELFSDYETGAWSPVAARFTGGAISATYNTQAGYYTKVGNLVTCSFYIDISSISQGSSLTYISGLPYAPARSYYDVGTTGNNTAFTTVDVVSMLAHTDSRLYFREAGNTSSNSSAAWAAGALSGTITYMTS